MELKQLTINIPDFIDFDEIERNVKETLDRELRDIVKRVIQNKIFETPSFQNMFREAINGIVLDLAKTTNLSDILMDGLLKSANEIEPYRFSMYGVDPILKEVVEENKDIIKKSLEPQLLNKVEEGLDDWDIKRILSEIASEELTSNGDYKELLKDMIQSNFDGYFTKKEE